MTEMLVSLKRFLVVHRVLLSLRVILQVFGCEGEQQVLTMRWPMTALLL